MRVVHTCTSPSPARLIFAYSRRSPALCKMPLLATDDSIITLRKSYYRDEQSASTCEPPPRRRNVVAEFARARIHTSGTNFLNNDAFSNNERLRESDGRVSRARARVATQWREVSRTYTRRRLVNAEQRNRVCEIDVTRIGPRVKLHARRLADTKGRRADAASPWITVADSTGRLRHFKENARERETGSFSLRRASRSRNTSTFHVPEKGFPYIGTSSRGFLGDLNDRPFDNNPHRDLNEWSYFSAFVEVSYPRNVGSQDCRRMEFSCCQLPRHRPKNSLNFPRRSANTYEARVSYRRFSRAKSKCSTDGYRITIPFSLS